MQGLGDVMRTRVKRFFEKVTDVDAVILQNGVTPLQDANFFYFTGIPEGLFENSSVVMRPSDGIEVITYVLEEQSAKGFDFDLTVHKERDGFPKVVDRLRGAKRIGFNGEALSYNRLERIRKALPEAAFIDVSKDLDILRSIKGEKEIANIKRSADIVSRTAKGVAGQLRTGMTEMGLAAWLVTKMYSEGANGTSFEPLVCFGPNTAVIHHSPAKTKLRQGSFVMCDYGSLHNRYASDITRTWVYGKANTRMKAIYETVEHARAAALETLRAGVNTADVHRAVLQVIDKAGFKGYMPHGTGHGLGLNVHDGMPTLHDEKPMVLLENMVCTVEPGVYIPGLGGVRIEDDVVVQKGRPRILTTAPRELIEVPVKPQR